MGIVRSRQAPSQFKCGFLNHGIGEHAENTDKRRWFDSVFSMSSVVSVFQYHKILETMIWRFGICFMST